ncbi:hypothetical protein ACP70R_036152 [Stipagrostis hirtigluma subsp. patula]
MKAPAVAMLLLLALVAAAAARDAADPATGAASATTDAATVHRHGYPRRVSEAHPMGLTQCVTVCGSQVTTCLMNCYQTLTGGNPLNLPSCLLGCTNDAMVCATACSNNLPR